MKTKKNATRKRMSGGFTLVEMLVVVTIIGIILSFTLPGVNTVLRTTDEFAIRMEIADINMAFEQYKLLYGEYPPSDPNDINAHVNKLFPLRNQTQDTIPANMDRAQLLVFFLRGYSANEEYPVSGDANNDGEDDDPSNRQSLIEFDNSRLKDKTSWAAATATDSPTPIYIAKKCGGDAPYLYFNINNDAAMPYIGPRTTGTFALVNIPGSDMSGGEKIAIVAAGLDGKFTSPQYSQDNIYNGERKKAGEQL